MSKSAHMRQRRDPKPKAWFIQRRRNKQWVWTYVATRYSYGAAWRLVRGLAATDTEYEYRATDDLDKPDDY